jgi:hypothetical protein
LNGNSAGIASKGGFGDGSVDLITAQRAKQLNGTFAFFGDKSVITAFGQNAIGLLVVVVKLCELVDCELGGSGSITQIPMGRRRSSGCG